MSIKISVIIPCYNVGKFLPKCFMSLVLQTMGIEDIELIFVNDASTDDGITWNLLEEMERAYPENILLINLLENMRQGGARNIGLEYARGEYISFVDSDDWVELQLYEVAYQAAKNENADIVQFGHKVYVDSLGVVEELGKCYEPQTIHINTAEQRKQMLMEEKITYGCWNKLYRREMIQKAGVKYAEHVVYEEPLFVYPLLYYAEKFVILREQLYVYRQNIDGTMRLSMQKSHTLLQHAQVQMQTWKFMKKTEFFQDYAEEIAFYFFHTYLYETLCFACNRKLRISLSEYEQLKENIKAELGIPIKNKYLSVFSSQKKLADMLERNINQKELDEYIRNL